MFIPAKRTVHDPLLSVTTVFYREIQSKRCQRWDPVAQIEGEDFPSDAKSGVAARSRRCGSARLRAPVSTVTLRQGRTVNLNHVLDYNTSGSSTLFFRFGRTHITPG